MMADQKDTASDTPSQSDIPQQPSCNSSDSDPESISDQPVQIPPPQVVPQVVNLPRWEDREEMYQKHVQDLEEELSKALKNNVALSGQLYEMGCLVFPEVELCDTTSPSFAEKLKVYLESLLLERQQLEKRALRAERTLWEMENEVSVLEGRLHDGGYRGTQRMECSALSGPSSPPFSKQHIRSFFSKIHRKSPEKTDAAEESFGEVVSSKKSPVKDALSKISWGATKKARYTERKRSVPQEKIDVLPEHRLPRSFCHSGAGSSRSPPELSESSTSRFFAGHSDTCVAQIHGHWETDQEREQENVVRNTEDDSLSTTSTLPVTTPLGGGSEEITISPGTSVYPSRSPSLQVSETENRNVLSELEHLAIVEGNSETGMQGEDVTSKESECGTSASLSSKNVAGHVFENLSVGQTSPQKPEDLDAETFRDPSCCAQGSGQTADTEPGSGEAAVAEQASCRWDSLQKPGKLSPLEPGLKANLPSSSIAFAGTGYPLADQNVLGTVPGPNKKADQSIPVEDDSAATFSLQLVPGEQLPSVVQEALASILLESPQPPSLTEESLSCVSEETSDEPHRCAQVQPEG